MSVGNPGEIDFVSIELARGSSNRESTELARKIVLAKYQKTLEGRPATAAPSKLTQRAVGSLTCSKRSDSGERCEVKIAMKSRGGLGREVRERL